MKKLAIFIYSLDAGGAERVVSILLPELSKQYHITLILMNKTINYEIPDTIDIIYLEQSKADESNLSKLIKIPYLAYKYAKLCNKESIDISISLLTRPNFIALLSRYFIHPLKLIICEHSLLSQQYHDSSIKSTINKLLIKYLYPHANSIISVSRGVTNDLINNFNIKNPIHTISNPIDLDSIEKQVDEPITFDFSPFTFVNIGRLDTGKNHKLLIQAFHKLHLNNPNTQLVIIGEGLLKESLLTLITQLNLQQCIFLVGHQSNPYAWLNKSDSFILTSQYESFGVVLIEALACNLPIISTDCPCGPREILDPHDTFQKSLSNSFYHAEYGILTPTNNSDILADAMQELVNTPNLVNKYRKKARIRVNDFTKEKICNSYLKVIEDL